MGLRTCTCCKKEKEANKKNFYKTSKGGWQGQCKECTKEKARNNYYKPEVYQKRKEERDTSEYKEKIAIKNKEYKADPKNKERQQKHSRRSWEKIKNDPVRHKKKVQKKKEYYQENRDHILEEQRIKYAEDEEYCEQKKAQVKKYAENNNEKVRRAARDYYYKNKKEINAKGKIYRSIPKNKIKAKIHLKDYTSRPENKERRRTNYKRRMEENTVAYAGTIIRSQLHRIIKNTGKRKMQKTFSLIPYTQQDLIDHLNTGIYTWEQYYGNTKEFHIDHIIPVAYYANLMMSTQSEELTEEDKVLIKKCNALRNLRIWPADENLEKKDKIDMKLIKQYGIEDLL